MNLVSRRSFLPQWLVLGLTILLELHRPAQATPSEKKEREDKQDTVSTPTAPSKEEKTSKNNQDTTNTKSTAQNKDKTAGNNEEAERTASTPDKEEENKPPKKPRIRKPKPLEPVKLAQEDPLASLDKLIVKQEMSLAPYVPLVQTIDIAVDYGRLAMNLWRRQESRYVGSLSILWRKNIQLSGTWGYNQLRPSLVRGNNEAYTVQGQYGSLGLAYFAKYDLYNNLYAGLRHSRSYFTNSTESTSKDLTASWWELIIGSEQQLFRNSGIYAGLTFHLKGLGSFGSFEPATNYEVPGYGRSVSPVEPSISLYIKYEMSFLKKQISFSTPKTN